MTEPQASSRRSRQSRQSRQSAAPAPHNTEEVEFSANQPLNSLRAVRSIPVNPRLQMHTAGLRERDERAARKAAKKAAKAQPTDMAQKTQAATQNQYYPQSHSSSAGPLFSGPDITNVIQSSPVTPVFQGSSLMLPPHTNVGGLGWNQNQYVGPHSSSSLISNDIQSWTQNQHHGGSQSSPLSIIPNLPGNPSQNVTGPTPNLPQAPYSFLDDLNSAELNEIAADSMANNSDPNSSSSSESDKDEIAKVDEESNLNEHASSGLTLTRRHVELTSHKRKTQTRSSSPLSGQNSFINSDPDDDGPHSKTTRKKPRASRSINGLDETEQEVIRLAYDKLKTALTNIQPWPDTEESPNKLQTEADEMASDAWDDSCIALKVSVDPSRKVLKMIKERISQFRGTLKTMAVDRVPAHYGFVDISTIENPTPLTIAELKEKNRALVTKLRERFYYRDPHDVHMTDKNGMYRNSIIQYLLNSQWFAKEKSHRRSHDYDGQTMLPLVTLAFILTAISCAIDAWETGEKVTREFDRITYWPRYNKHLKKLAAWAAFSAKPNSVELAGGHDLCAELREDLLRNSRTRLPVIAQQVADTTGADDEAAMLAEFAANFS